MPSSYIISPMVSGRPVNSTQESRIQVELGSAGFWGIVLGYELSVEPVKSTVMVNGNYIPPAIFIDDTTEFSEEVSLDKLLNK